MKAWIGSVVADAARGDAAYVEAMRAAEEAFAEATRAFGRARVLEREGLERRASVGREALASWAVPAEVRERFAFSCSQHGEQETARVTRVLVPEVLPRAFEALDEMLVEAQRGFHAPFVRSRRLRGSEPLVIADRRVPGVRWRLLVSAEVFAPMFARTRVRAQSAEWSSRLVVRLSLDLRGFGTLGADEATYETREAGSGVMGHRTMRGLARVAMRDAQAMVEALPERHSEVGA